MTRVGERSAEQKERDRESNKESQRRRRARIRSEHAAGLVDIPAEKRCSYCTATKPADAFPRSVNARDGLYGHCRECCSSLGRERTERYKADDLGGWQKRRADAVRKYRHGITGDEYALLAEAQEFCCAICAQPEELCVDHDHKTGEIRGLLCKKCNSGIGLLGDDPARVATALTYLLKGG